MGLRPTKAMKTPNGLTLRTATGVFNGVTMGLRPTKVVEDAKWGGPPGPRGSPWTRSSGVVDFLTRPTRASPADQGVRPT
jgi:hypothetical protein